MSGGGLLGEDSNPRYAVPKDSEHVFELPAGLFTNGWIHVLEDTELAFLLMLALLRRVIGNDEVYVAARIGCCISASARDAYRSHHLLHLVGLVDVQVDPNQHEDGRVPKGDPLILNRFQLLDEGFAGPASATARSAIRCRLGLERHIIPVTA